MGIASGTPIACRMASRRGSPGAEGTDMQWLETIRLLASRGKIEILLRRLADTIAELKAAEGEEDLAIYSSQTFDSDLLFCIRWRKDGLPRKTREGLLLAEYLTGFGMVDHAIWKQELPIGDSAPRPPLPGSVP
jgi:hypothetical protein